MIEMITIILWFVGTKLSFKMILPVSELLMVTIQILQLANQQMAYNLINFKKITAPTIYVNMQYLAYCIRTHPFCDF